MINIAIYDQDRFVQDVSAYASNVVFGSNENGYEGLSFDVPNFIPLNRTGYKIIVSRYGYKVWEGIITSVSVGDVISIVCMGSWVMLGYNSYTYDWVVSGTQNDYYRRLSRNDILLPTPAFDEDWQTDTADGLYMAMVAGSASTTQVMIGYKHPSYQLAYVEFDYDFFAPANVQFRVSSNVQTFWNITTDELSVVGNGALQSGTFTGFINSGSRSLIFRAFGDGVYSPTTTGDTYVKISNLKMVSWPDNTGAVSDITSKEVIGNILDETNSLIPYISDSQVLVFDPDDSQTNLSYLEANTQQIIAGFADINNYLASIWGDGYLVYQGEDTNQKTWYVNALSITNGYDVNETNTAISIFYTDDSTGLVSSRSQFNVATAEKIGFQKRRRVNSQVTNSTDANNLAISLYDDTREVARSTVEIDTTGIIPELIRANDRIVILNITYLQEDTIREFVVKTTSYNAETNTLTVTPKYEDFNLASSLAGFF